MAHSGGGHDDENDDDDASLSDMDALQDEGKMGMVTMDIMRRMNDNSLRDWITLQLIWVSRTKRIL